MSQVTLLAADCPLPPHRSESSLFSVRELDYYRASVELLGLEIKPFRYEMELENTPQGAKQLRDYLRKHGLPGMAVQLWNLWVGDTNVRAFHLTGLLDALDGDTLQQLREREQTCITILL